MTSLVAFLLLTVLLILDASPHAAASFTWEAAIEPTTGVATSRELSRIKIQRNSLQDSVIQQTSKDLIASWADFLCQGRITFGLLQTKHDSIAGTASLHFRGFPKLSIMTFGSVQQRQPYQWELPIMPTSWLALPNDDHHPHYFGCLRFECKPVKTHRLDSETIVVTHNESGGRQEVDEPLLLSTPTLLHQHDLELESQIVDYRPWLAGKAPVSRVRKFIYMHTQSQIHAYVTRRFHTAWREALCTSS
jgi:hypothetical protein